MNRIISCATFILIGSCAANENEFLVQGAKVELAATTNSGSLHSAHVGTSLWPKSDEDRFELRSPGFYYFETRGLSFGPNKIIINDCPADQEQIDLGNCTFQRHISTVFNITPGEYIISPHSLSQDGGFEEAHLRTLVTVEGPNMAPYDLAEVGFGTGRPTGTMNVKVPAGNNKLVVMSRYTDRPYKRWGHISDAAIISMSVQP